VRIGPAPTLLSTPSFANIRAPVFVAGSSFVDSPVMVRLDGGADATQGLAPAQAFRMVGGCLDPVDIATGAPPDLRQNATAWLCAQIMAAGFSDCSSCHLVVSDKVSLTLLTGSGDDAFNATGVYSNLTLAFGNGDDVVNLADVPADLNRAGQLGSVTIDLAAGTDSFLVTGLSGPVCCDFGSDTDADKIYVWYSPDPALGPGSPNVVDGANVGPLGFGSASQDMLSVLNMLRQDMLYVRRLPFAQPPRTLPVLNPNNGPSRVEAPPSKHLPELTDYPE
jgi:hypothetical protein